jgi:uncharacterized BrkB/YihY/UPF0761 family membrane protein
MKAVIITALVFMVATIVIGEALNLVQESLNAYQYEARSELFKTPSAGFPLVLVVISFIYSFIIVYLYSRALPQLPENIWVRGILVGLFLFLIGDLLKDCITYYRIAIPGAITLAQIIVDLFNRVLSGLVLTYTYRRVTREKQVDSKQ